MSMNTVARDVVKPTAMVRPSSPASPAVKPIDILPGSLIPSDAPRIVGTADNSLGLIAALRERLTGDLGLSYATIDALAGWGETYATKVLGPEPFVPKDANGWRPTARSLGPLSLDILLGVACVRLMLVEDPAALERLRRHRDYVRRRRPVRSRGAHDYIVRRDTREHMRQMGRLGGLATAAKLSAKRRTALARKAAKARWHKPRITEVACAPGTPATHRPNTSVATAPRAAPPVARPKRSGATAGSIRPAPQRQHKAKGRVWPKRR